MTKQSLQLAEDIPPSPFWLFVLRFGLAGVVIVFYLTAMLHYQYTPDDTYIYLQYAKNIAQGEGFSFNAGIPSYGVMGPLWVLLLAIGARIGLDPFIVAKTFDVLFASLSIILAQLVALHVTRHRFYSFFAAVFVGFDAWLLRWAGTGLETSLATFLVLMTLWNLVMRDAPLAAGSCGLLTLVRPEGVLFFALVLVKAWEFGRIRDAQWRTLGYTLLFFLIIVVPWIFYALITFGTIVPNSYPARTFGMFDWRESVRAVAASIQVLVGSQAVVCVFLGGGVFVAWLRNGARFLWREAAPVAVVVALVAGDAVVGVRMLSRYLLPVIPVVVIYGLWGMQRLEEAFRIPFRRMVVVMCVVSVVVMVQNAVLFGTRAVPHIVNYTRGMDDCFRPMAYWLREHSEPDAVVLARDVGLLGYISDRVMYDTPGVITPAMHRAFAGRTDAEGIREHAYETVVHPAFVVDAAPTRETLRLPNLDPVMTLEFPEPGFGTHDPVFYTLYRVLQ